MMCSRKTAFGILGLLLSSCLVMYFIETAVQPGYLVKSLCKVGVFLILPMIYCVLDRNILLKDIFRFRSGKQALISLGLGVMVYGFIMGGFFLLKGFIDLDKIAVQLTDNLNITRENFIFVALYISFVNSLLEEFFFRGFAFLSLKRLIPRVYAYTVSALAFSLYHVAILTGWFSPWLFILMIAGLFVSGLFFNWLNDKHENLYNSWLVHMFANFAINTIGFYMFGLI